MLGPNLPYLPKMYYFRFFSINLVNFSYPHLLICLTRIPHDEESNLCIFSPKSLCKDRIINSIKYKDVCKTFLKLMHVRLSLTSIKDYRLPSV